MSNMKIIKYSNCFWKIVEKKSITNHSLLIKEAARPDEAQHGDDGPVRAGGLRMLFPKSSSTSTKAAAETWSLFTKIGRRNSEKIQLRGKIILNNTLNSLLRASKQLSFKFFVHKLILFTKKNNKLKWATFIRKSAVLIDFIHVMRKLRRYITLASWFHPFSNHICWEIYSHPTELNDKENIMTK